GHAFLQHHALPRLAVMQHLRVVVVDLADAVAAVLADHAEALGLGVLLDRVADVAQGRARLHRADAAEHGLAGGLDQAPGHHRGLAHVVHAAGVAVPAILDHGDVDVEDVAVLEDLARAGNAVADDVVDRGADRGREAAVADVGRNGALDIDDVVVADPVQFGRGHAGLHVGGHDLENLGRQAAGDAHLLQVGGGLELDGHPAIIAYWPPPGSASGSQLPIQVIVRPRMGPPWHGSCFTNSWCTHVGFTSVCFSRGIPPPTTQPNGEIPMSFRNLSVLAAGVLVAGLSATANAATDTKNFNVTMTITGACDIHTGTATNVDFGSHAAGGGDQTATGNLIVNCSDTTPYAITLSNGANYAGGRRMKSGSNYIPYGLFSDAGATIAWTSVAGTGNGLDQNIPVYGKVLSASYATAIPGNYTDTVTATVTY